MFHLYKNCLVHHVIGNGKFVTGKDKSVILWSIHDHISSLAADQGAHKSPGSKGNLSNGKPGEGTTVEARGIFQGHEDTVEDVQFNPSR